MFINFDGGFYRCYKFKGARSGLCYLKLKLIAALRDARECFKCMFNAVNSLENCIDK